VSGADSGLQLAIGLGRQIASDLAGFGVAGKSAPANAAEAAQGPQSGGDLLAEYDRRIGNAELRAATRSRFESGHYADAIETGVKALNTLIRSRTGRTEDGDPLMTLVFSPNKPLLRINKNKSKADESAQRGHMLLCQGVIAAWRNPRAHALTVDDPVRCLMMLENIGDLMDTTSKAVRTRRHP
jgi:uncharacterized protein (TIGR02391 family)